MARIVLPRLLDPATGGRRSLSVAGADVGAVVTAMLAEVPAVGVHLFDHTGALRPHVLCFLDGRSTRLTDRSESVGADAEMRFVQAVSGG